MNKAFKIPISVLVLIINARQEVLLIRRVISQKTKNHLRNFQNKSGEDFWTSQGIHPYQIKTNALTTQPENDFEFWQSITGSLDFEAESLFQAARREVFEEIGIHIPSHPISVQAFKNILCNCHHLQASAVQNNIYMINLAQSSFYQISEIWRHRYEPNITHNHEHAFLLSLPNNAISTIKLNPKEHDEYRWLPYPLALTKCFSPSNQKMLQFAFECIFR